LHVTEAGRARSAAMLFFHVEPLEAFAELSFKCEE
jgi:hypothetical protein